jgi:hypothetical protein
MHAIVPLHRPAKVHNSNEGTVFLTIPAVNAGLPLHGAFLW